MNASEVTRFFPIENGVGYGSARISVLFRPVQASLPPNLLGFDYGTILIRKLTAKLDNDENTSLLNTCDIKLQVSASHDGISSKSADINEEGSVVWNDGNGSTEIAVRHRYSSALVVTFKKHGAISSSTYAMAVLWLRDVVDGVDGVNEFTIFQSHHDYNRLKQNYVPPDGSLDMWSVGKDKMSRIGTVKVDMTFVPGIGSAHRKLIDKADRSQRRMWDEVDLRSDAGLQGQIGRNEERERDASVDNTQVPQDEVQDETHHHENEDGDMVDGTTHYSLDGRSDSEDGDSGLLDKLREWKRHEKELHKQHRGVMQMKPFRTAEWLKDNTKQAGHKVVNRFKMQSREPDVETEV